MLRPVIVLGCIAALAAGGLAVARTSRQEAARLAADYYRKHPDAPPLSGPQRGGAPVRKPAPPSSVAAVPAPAPQPTAPVASPSPVRQIFKIGNDAGVANGATRPSLFALDGPTLIVRLTDYHWNSGRGAPAGTIAIRAADGRVWGPWRVTLINGVYWQTTPNVVLPAGRYEVLDSDPATWSQNSLTGGAGMTWADGAPQ